MTLRSIPLAVAAALAAAACGAAPRQIPDITDELRGYHEGLRWRRYDDSALRIAPREREAFLDEREELDEDLRIDDWELLRLRFRDDRERARVDVRFTWHLDSRGIVHKSVVRQEWERRGDLWILAAEVQLRGEAMPGVDQPPDGQGDATEDAGSGG
jgi:hypothetical protein